jgi:RHS repeat-associated protein
VKNDTVSQGFQYDGPGARLSQEDTIQQGLSTTIKYGYDDRGRPVQFTYPSGRVVRYEYDNLNRITSVAQNGSVLAMLPAPVGYDAWENRQTLLFTSGTQDQWVHDPSGTRLQQWTTWTKDQDATGHVESRAYRYDAADRLIEAGEWTALGYDTNSRLIRAEGSGLQAHSGYDAFGNNIMSLAIGNVPSGMNNFTFLPQPGNQLPPLTLNGGLTDAATNAYGEITRLATAVSSGQDLVFAWDPLGRLASVSNSATGVAAAYRYNPFGFRVAQMATAGSSLERAYAYNNQGQLLSEFVGQAGTAMRPTAAAEDGVVWNRDVIYLGDLPVAEIDARGIHELHGDHLNTPRTITAGMDGMAVPKGRTEGTQAFGPHGESLSNFTSGYLPLTGYTGHLQTEPNGLIYMKGRFYSPAWHRFLNSDHGADPKRLNQYAYVGGNPLMATDPTGMVDGGMNSRDAANHVTAHEATREAEGHISRGELSGALREFSDRYNAGGGGDIGYGGAFSQHGVEGVEATLAQSNQSGPLFPVFMWNYTSSLIPHTFIQTPNLTLGFYPVKGWHYAALLVTSPGEIRDDSKHKHDNWPARTFMVDAATLEKVEQGMKWNPGFYELNNGMWNHAFNCTGWANRVLEGAGLHANWSGVGANPWTN